jgi:hypothetical protein
MFLLFCASISGKVVPALPGNVVFVLCAFASGKVVSTWPESALELSDAPQSQDEFTIPLNHFRKVNRTEFGVREWQTGGQTTSDGNAGQAKGVPANNFNIRRSR